MLGKLNYACYVESMRNLRCGRHFYDFFERTCSLCNIYTNINSMLLHTGASLFLIDQHNQCTINILHNIMLVNSLREVEESGSHANQFIILERERAWDP